MSLAAAVAAALMAASGSARAVVELGTGNTYSSGTAADQTVVIGDGNSFPAPVPPSTTNEENTVIGDDNQVRGAGNIVLGSDNQVIGGQNIIIGNGGLFASLQPDGNAVIVGNGATAQLQGAAFGYSAEARDYSTAIGAESTAGTYSVALGYQSNALFDQAVAIGYGAESNGIGALAIGAGARAQLGAIAIGAGSIATEANTVSFSDGVTLRRLTGLADGIAGSDAVTLSQMTSITDSMSQTLSNLSQQLTGVSGRVTALESSQGAGGGVDQSYADAGDARTLSSAQTYADAGDARTLGQANTYADAGDARTLSLANAYSDAGDARTLASAQAYARSLVDDMEDKLSAGIAAVAAQPMLPSIAVGQKAIAVGHAYFNGKVATGIAGGFAPMQGMTVSAGVSAAVDGRPVFRTGVSYVW